MDPVSQHQPAPTSALPQRRTTPTLADLSPHYPAPDELARLLPGESYCIEGFLGQGGMGAVYHGLQISLNRPVAIKILQLGVGVEYDYADRFRREAQALAALSHPNIVNVIDFGTASGKYLYIVMEFIDGSDLHHVLKAGQMTQEIALHIVPQICDALAYAHEHGIVHRDIKPANIMLTRDWRVKVADFGLAKRFDANSTLVTRTNMSMGTPDYAAPEQFDDPATVDHRADIYALGVTFYQMLTGALPRGAWQPPSAMVQTDPRLDPLVIKAMMPRREERYQSARELQHSLIHFTQTLAWEASESSASGSSVAQPARPSQDSVHAPGSSPPQAPQAQKPIGKINPPQAGRASPHPAHQQPSKPKTPLYLGLGFAAALAVGAFFLFGGKKAPPASRERVAQSARPADAPPSAAPQTPAPTAKQATLTLDPALQAKLDAVPWATLDVAGMADSSGKLPSHYSNSKGSGEWKDGKAFFKGGFYFRVVGKPVTDCAVRIRVAPYAAENSCRISLRKNHSSTSSSTRINAGRKSNGPLGSLTCYDESTNQHFSVGADNFPMPPVGVGYILEVFAIGSTWGVRVDGELIALAESDKVPHPGPALLYCEEALIESIEYKILDGVAAPPVTAAKTAAWQKFDLSGPLEHAYGTVRGSAKYQNGRLEIRDNFYLRILKEARDVALRVRWLANPSEDDNKLGLRALTSGEDKRLSSGRSSKNNQGGIFLVDVKPGGGGQHLSLFAPPLPQPGTAWTQETFAIGNVFGTFVDGKLVAYAESAETAPSGHAHVYAKHADIASIEYLVLDGVPREQWPVHLREAVESRAGVAQPARPTPDAESPSTSPPDGRASATPVLLSLAAPGWTRLDLAEVKEVPGKVERLPDGAVSLNFGWIWTDTGYPGDSSIRARFRGAPDASNLRVMLRDDQDVCYMANVSRDGFGSLQPYARMEKTVSRMFKQSFPRIDTSQTFTLELRAQGGTLTVLVDGKEVARAQDDQLKFGRLGVFADHGIVEGIAYQTGGSASVAAEDDAGWQKMDFATAKFATKAERLPDGALKPNNTFVWSEQSYEDVEVRVRFRPGAALKFPRILVRDSDGVAYAMSSQAVFRYVWGGDARARGDEKTKGGEVFRYASPVKGVETMHLRVRGDQLTGFINGQQVAEARDAMLTSGRVGFLVEDGIVESFEIKPITTDRATLQPGELLWKTNVGGNINGPPSQGPDGTVYVAVESSEPTLVAVHPQDGTLHWKAPLAGNARSGVAPVVADDGSVLIVVHGSDQKGVLHCMDGKEGKERWRFAFEESGTFAESSVAVSADGRVYLAHRDAWCLDLATGAQHWTLPFPGFSHTAPVIAPDGTVAFFPGSNVLAVHPLDGRILWKTPMAAGCWGNSAADGSALYVAAAASTGPQGTLYAFNFRDGRKLWENKLGGAVDASLALDAAGRIFTTNSINVDGRATDRSIIACDAATGATLWQAHKGLTKTPYYTIGADGLVYTLCDLDIVCLKPESGEIVWKQPVRDAVQGAPLLLDDGLLLAGSRDKYLYAIQTSSRGLADSPWPTMGQNNRRNGRAHGAQIVVHQDTPTDKKLREIEAAARAEYEAGPGKVFADAAATLRAFYANALQQRAAQSQQAGQLEVMLAFKQEADAFTAGTLTTPPADAPGTPDALKQLRATFLARLAEYETARDQAAAPIYARWDTALATLQADLTKAGEINDALRVKKLRDQIVATKALTLSSTAGRDSGPATGASTVPTSTTSRLLPTANQPPATAPAPKLAKVDDRKIAEWVLSIPKSQIQYLNTATGNPSVEITSAGKLPKNDFSLYKVQIADGSKATEANLLQVAALPELRELRIESNGFNCLTPAVIAALAQAPDFARLHLSGTNLEDADFAPLAGKKMTWFGLGTAPKFTGKALAHFATHPLRTLRLLHCPVTEDAFEHIARMKDLEDVEFHGLKVSPPALERLPAAKLTRLRLSDMKHLSGKLDFLLRFERLEKLEFGYQGALSDADAQVLARMKSLTALNATGMNDETIARLAVIPRLVSLTLPPYNGTGKNLGVLAALKNLRNLALNGTLTKVTDEGLAALATSLPQIEALNLDDAPLITDAGLAEVAKLTKLTRLKLKNTRITDAGLEPLKALRKLEELDLTGTKVTPAAAATLQRALPKCKITGP